LRVVTLADSGDESNGHKNVDARDRHQRFGVDAVRGQLAQLGIDRKNTLIECVEMGEVVVGDEPVDVGVARQGRTLVWPSSRTTA